MKIFVNVDIQNYFANVLMGAKKGDTNYMPEFDFNKDGIIDTIDGIYLSAHVGEWIEVGGGMDILIPIVSAVGGLVGGFAVAKLVK